MVQDRGIHHEIVDTATDSMKSIDGVAVEVAARGLQFAHQAVEVITLLVGFPLVVGRERLDVSVFIEELDLFGRQSLRIGVLNKAETEITVVRFVLCFHFANFDSPDSPGQLLLLYRRPR